MPRRTRYFIIYAIILLSAPPGATTKSHFPQEMTPSLHQFIGFVCNDDFAGAEQVLLQLESLSPRDPLLFMFRGVLYQSIMMADESDSLESQFYSVLDSAQWGAESLLTLGGDSALAYFINGQAHALRALHHGRAGHTWKAIKTGLAAGRHFTKAYEHDSTFHDIAVGLGSYRYWKSVKTRLLNWTPIFKNEKENGIELVRRAADSAEISREAATTSLIWIYINEKRFAEAIRLADQMHREYPDGHTYLWALGDAHAKMKDYATAAMIYERLLERLLNRPGNYYNVIEISCLLAKCYRAPDQPDAESISRDSTLVNKIFFLPIPDPTRKKQKDRLAYLRRGHRK